MEFIRTIFSVIATCSRRCVADAPSRQSPPRVFARLIMARSVLSGLNYRMIVTPATSLIFMCFAFPFASHAQITEGWIQVQSVIYNGGTGSIPCSAFSQIATADGTTLRNDLTPVANQCINQVNTQLQAQCTKIGATSIGLPSLTSAVTFQYLYLGQLPTGVTEGFAYGWMPAGGCEGTNAVSANLSVSYGTYQCPAGGSIPFINYAIPFDEYPGVYCGAAFYVAAPQPPLAQMDSPDPAGEPVNPSTGNVYFTATDVRAVGSEMLRFQRYYNSADATGTDGVRSWRHSYGRSIATIYQANQNLSGYSPASVPTSPTYLTASAACTSGFAAIQSSVSGWAGAIATYSNGVCVLSVGGVTTGTLQVYSLVPLPPPPNPTPIEYDVVRDDGQTFRFTLQNGVINSQPGVSLRLAVTGSGFTVTDDGDNVETYNAAGLLQSITSRAGVVQTLSYSAGVWSGVTDSFGNSLSITRNSAGGIATVAVIGGGTVKYSYDPQQRLSLVTNLDNTTRSYLYGNSSFPNALTAVIDEYGTTLSTWNYDSQGRAMSAQQAGGANAISLTFNNDGSVSVADAPSGGQTFSYTRIGDINQATAISSICFTCQDAAATTYDRYGWVSSRTDYGGNLTCYAHDSTRGVELVRIEGFAPGSTCPSSLASYTPVSGTMQRKITTQWSTLWREPMLITELSRTTAFTYDGSGRTLTRKVTDLTASPTVSRSWTYTYDSFGHVLTAVGPRSNGFIDKTIYTYNTCTTGSGCGQVATITDQVGHVTTFNTYNVYGNPMIVTDPNNVVTTLTYDPRQHLKSRQVGTETTQYGYDVRGLLQTVTLPDSSTIQFGYDGAHRLTKVTDPSGNYVVYTLDAMGNRTAESSYDSTNTLRRTHSQVFNYLNELAQDINSGGDSASTYFGYDSGGNRTVIAAPLSRETGQQFDALNRVNQITDPNNGITNLSYDASNNLASVVDPRGLTTSYAHNGFNDITQVVSPDTGTTTYLYDSGGNTKTITDARSAAVSYGFDNANRLTKILASDQTVNFTYDAGTNGLGRLTSAADANHSMSWTYDTHGRVIGKGQTIASITKSVGYGYTNGNLTSIVTPSGQTITYGYTNHRITSITMGSTTLLSSVTYDPFGPATGWTWGNATASSRVFDQDGNPSQIVSAGVTNTYSVDYASRITGITDSGLSTDNWMFGYDVLDRATTASSSAKSRGYTYDANSNRKTTTGTTSSVETISATNNQLTSTTGGIVRTYAYDLAGNTTSYTGEILTYNQRGRLSSATSSAGTTNYIYNALGQLIEKSGNGGTTLLVYDEAGHILGEYSSTGALIQETVWMNDTPVATIRPNGAAVALYYVHTDHLGTPRKVTRPSDNSLMWRWDPDTFGSAAPTSAFIYNLRFPGQYALTESGLFYNGRRTYDPQMGRYLESDPIGLLGGLNTYAYVGGNPISRSDRRGLDPAGSEANALAALGPAVIDYLASNPDVALAAILALFTESNPLITTEEATILFHGTDAASAADIVANGVNMESAALLGGGDAFWTTTSSSDASLFAQANPILGSPATVSITVPNSVINSLTSSNLLSVQGSVYLFGPDAASILNSAAIFKMVPK